jgi:carbonic anhydrase
LAYAVTELGVKHVIVMGHYGCGGVAAAIASAPTDNVDVASGMVQNWIDPIRELFQTSARYVPLKPGRFGSRINFFHQLQA